MSEMWAILKQPFFPLGIPGSLGVSKGRRGAGPCSGEESVGGEAHGARRQAERGVVQDQRPGRGVDAVGVDLVVAVDEVVEEAVAAGCLVERGAARAEEW